MKILVTGGAGFIGSAVVRRAIDAGHEVINLDKLTYAANLENLADLKDSKQYTFEQIDLCDFNGVSSVFDNHAPDCVIHLAAESHVDRSIDGPRVFVETNIVGTFNLLQAARSYLDELPQERANVFRFLHVSTDEVYGDLDLHEPAFTETHTYSPSSPYSASKAASDHLVRAWGRTFGLPILITNCSNNYGPFQFPEKLIPVVIFNAMNGKPIPVYGTGQNIRDWLYVDDHVDAILTVLKNGTVGETYNIGGNNERSNIDLVRTLCNLVDQLTERTNSQSLITFVTDRPGHDRRYAINPSKIKNDLGWEPIVKFDEGFRSTVEWYLSNSDWWDAVINK